MLFPDQVIPFLQHDDERVRSQAAKYLAEAHDPSPATADDVWRAIDTVGVACARSLLSNLSKMPQTDASVDRLARALREIDDADVRSWLNDAAQDIAYDVL